MKQLILGLVAALSLGGAGHADRLKMAVTTSFHNSGLADILLPEIRADLGLNVQLIVVGTGQALRLGAAGDVDAILVHSPAAEQAFIAAGHGSHRREIMYNDFVLIGPQNDPATIALADDAIRAMIGIATTKANFVSRGDNSGTHHKELSLWQAAGLEYASFSGWYKSVGAGMGAALNTASGLGAYILSDRASWLNFGNKSDLKLLFSGDPLLFNQYGFIPINPKRHRHVKHQLAAALEVWLTSDKAKTLINGYQISGQALFVFNGQAQ